MVPRTRLTVLSLIRFVVGLHFVALFVLPKTSFGLVSLRPEDLTGVALIGLMLSLALSGPIAVPRESVWVVGILYMTYFWVTFLWRDAVAGHPQAIVLWAKEVSYFAFGYLVWRSYRTAPRVFLRVALLAMLPTLCFGLFQVFTTARGSYGISPLGHESSPASSGMIYFGCAMVIFLYGVSGRHATALRALLVVSLVLLVATGSKLAVLGAVTFFGAYLLLDVLHRRTGASLKRLAWFAISTTTALSAAVALAWSGYVPKALTRYRGFADPLTTLADRGIWWKLKWIDGPIDMIAGAGYSAGHLSGGAFSYGMAMDNQVLYYLVRGGAIGLLMYGLLCLAVFVALPARSDGGRVLRALVVSYVSMGLGGEVLQLSIFGNVFWMVVGLCLCGVTGTSTQTSAAVR